jgi:hypothetical protein
MLTEQHCPRRSNTCKTLRGGVDNGNKREEIVLPDPSIRHIHSRVRMILARGARARRQQVVIPAVAGPSSDEEQGEGEKS